MRSFNDPAPCPRSFTLGLALIPTTPNPRHHADLPDMVIDAASDIDPIQARPRAQEERRWHDDAASQCVLEQHAVLPVHVSDVQSIFSSASHASSPCCQKRSKTPVSGHARNRRWTEEYEHKPLASSAPHHMPVRRYSRIASIAPRSGMRCRRRLDRCALGGGSTTPSEPTSHRSTARHRLA